MNAFWKRFACMAMAVLTPAVLCGCEQKAPVQGICYQVTGGKNTMVILGSIHVGSPEMEPYGKHIQNAMEQADVFVFECDSDSPDAAAQIQAMMLLEEGTLQQSLPPELWEQLLKACAATSLNADGLNVYKPWAVTSMLTTAAAAREMGARSSRQAVSRGVEQEVAAHVKGREIRYLETAHSQLSLMDGFSPELQQALLQQACDAVLKPSESTSLADWPLWWRDGNEQAFSQEYAKDDSLPPMLAAEYHQASVSQRNEHMAQMLLQMLEEESEKPRQFFVTVGLMHLVLPEDSILHLLEQNGYTAWRLTFQPE